MENIPSTRNDLTKIFQVLLKKKWLILCCVIGVILPTYYINNKKLPVYQATATIVIEEVKGTIPGIGTVDTRLGYTFVMNQIEELKSYALMHEVTKRLPDSVLNTYSNAQQVQSRDKMIQALTPIILGSVFASPVPNSDVIKIRAKSFNPVAACVIANTVAEVLKQRNLEARLGDVYSLQNTIEEKLVDFKIKVTDAEFALKKFKERNKVIDLNQETKEIISRVTKAEVEYNRINTLLGATKIRYSFLQKKLTQIREELVTNMTTVTSPKAQELKKKLVELEVQYTTLNVKDYNDNHPKMVQLKKQIDETKINLRKELLKIAKGESTIDPLSQIQTDLQEIASLEIEIHTYEAQEKALQNILDDYDLKLKLVPGKELELGQLLREKDVADKIYTMLLQKREEARIRESEKIGNIRIIDSARVPYNPIGPQKRMTLILGLFFGLSLGIGLALLSNLFDKTIKTDEEIKLYTGFKTIGSIPHIKKLDGHFHVNKIKFHTKQEHSFINPKLVTLHEVHSPAAEAFRTLRTNLQASQIDGSIIKTIVITSANPEEGKSFIAANLAISIAQLGLKTILIDTDLRKSVMHTYFDKEIQPGLMDIFITFSRMKQSEMNKKINNGFDSQIQRVIHKTYIPNLHVITSGALPPNPSEVLASDIMKSLNNYFRNHYDIVIYDMPPVVPVTDASILIPEVDSVVFVVSTRKSKQNDILKAKAQIEMVANTRIVGAVINKVDYHNGYYSSYYYRRKPDKTVWNRMKKNIGEIFNLNMNL